MIPYVNRRGWIHHNHGAVVHVEALVVAGHKRYDMCAIAKTYYSIQWSFKLTKYLELKLKENRLDQLYIRRFGRNSSKKSLTIATRCLIEHS